MSSTDVQGRLDSEATQYANVAGASQEMYCEGPPVYYVNTLPPDSEFAPVEPAAQKWPVTLMLAGVGLVAAFLLAFLTLSMVRGIDPVEPTRSGVVTSSITAVPTETAGRQRFNQAPAVQPSSQPRSSASMTSPVLPQPPATMTNPLEPPPTRTVTVTPQPPATMTNPLEPPPATMTNPLEPPATMTNPLEPPATMTNPLEPPLIGSSAPEE